MFNTDNSTFLSYLPFRYIPAYQIFLAASLTRLSNITYPKVRRVSLLLHNTLNFWALFSLMVLSTFFPGQKYYLKHFEFLISAFLLFSDLDGRNQINIEKFLIIIEIS